MTLDIVKAASLAKAEPYCTCTFQVIDPNCKIHGNHFTDADVDDEPIDGYVGGNGEVNVNE